MKRLIIEAPDAEAIVDFISEGVSVELRIRGGELVVETRMSHGEGASTWDEHATSYPLPEKR